MLARFELNEHEARIVVAGISGAIEIGVGLFSVRQFRAIVHVVVDPITTYLFCAWVDRAVSVVTVTIHLHGAAGCCAGGHRAVAIAIAVFIDVPGGRIGDIFVYFTVAVFVPAIAGFLRGCR